MKPITRKILLTAVYFISIPLILYFMSEIKILKRKASLPIQVKILSAAIAEYNDNIDECEILIKKDGDLWFVKFISNINNKETNIWLDKKCKIIN